MKNNQIFNHTKKIQISMWSVFYWCLFSLVRKLILIIWNRLPSYWRYLCIIYCRPWSMHSCSCVRRQTRSALNGGPVHREERWRTASHLRAGAMRVGQYSESGQDLWKNSLSIQVLIWNVEKWVLFKLFRQLCIKFCYKLDGWDAPIFENSSLEMFVNNNHNIPGLNLAVDFCC